MTKLCTYKNSIKAVVLLFLLAVTPQSNAVAKSSLVIAGISTLVGAYVVNEAVAQDIKDLESTRLGTFVKNYICNPEKEPRKFTLVYTSLSAALSVAATGTMLFGCHQFIGWGARKFTQDTQDFKRGLDQKFVGQNSDPEVARQVAAGFAEEAEKRKREHEIIKKANIGELTVGEMLKYQKEVCLPKVQKISDNDSNKHYIVHTTCDLIEYLETLDVSKELGTIPDSLQEMGESQRSTNKFWPDGPNFGAMHGFLMSDSYDLMLALSREKLAVQNSNQNTKEE
jgi:hypothetical protein